MSSDPDDNSSTIDFKGLPKDPNLVETVAGHGGPVAGGLQPGMAIGSRYTILKILGRGGMGIVYQAWDAELGVPVAIKMILPHREFDEPNREAAETRFKRELLLARSVTHKNVVRIHDLGEVDGRKYITMPFVEGETLAAVMKRTGPMPVAQALMLAQQIAEGLRAAHDAGVVHRDLKPENVMVTPGGQALILDFGIARADVAGATQSGIVMGTLEYMAPEQAGGAPADHRTDLYAFGLILYDMLVGRQRLSGVETPMSELLERAKHAPPAPRTLRADLPERLDRIVLNCIQPEVTARFATTAALSNALSEVAPESQGARRRLHRWWPVVAAVALLTIGIAAWTYLTTRAIPPSPVSHPPMSMLIADFDNRTGDLVIGHLVARAIGVGIESSSFLNLLSRREAIDFAGLTPDATLDPAAAKRVALNEGIDVVLGGTIEANGTGYQIRIIGEPGKVVAGAPLFQIEREAPSSGALLSVLGQLSSEVRAALGDQDARPSRVRPDEMFSFSSLESAKAFVRATDHVDSRRLESASEELTRLTTDDPTSARAWTLLSATWTNQGQMEQANRAIAKAIDNIESATVREQFRIRAFQRQLARDADGATREYEALLKRFPGDPMALTNLAFTTLMQRDFRRASTLAETVAQLYSNSVIRRVNAALYAMYAGDFLLAQRHAQRAIALRPNSEITQLAWALPTAATGSFDEARAAYEKLGLISPRGRAFAAAGVADIDLMHGRPAEAARTIERATTADKATTLMDARLLVTLAEARLAQGRADDAASLALASSLVTDSPLINYSAGTVLIAAGQIDSASRIAELPLHDNSPDTRMLAKIISGELQLAKKDSTGAVARFKEAVAIADSWLARFALGRAYLESGAFADAQIEFDLCLKRRGEATAVFLDEISTLRRIVPVYYYQGLAQSGLKLSSANESFRTFLAFKEGGDEKSPLIDDARKRLR